MLTIGAFAVLYLRHHAIKMHLDLQNDAALLVLICEPRTDDPARR
jgi:hypothetical protein